MWHDESWRFMTDDDDDDDDDDARPPYHKRIDRMNSRFECCRRLVVSVWTRMVPFSKVPLGWLCREKCEPSGASLVKE